MIEYDPYSEVAVIKCRDGKLLADPEIALRRALGSWSVELKTREQHLANDTVSTLLKKAIERKVLLNKARYSGGSYAYTYQCYQYRSHSRSFYRS